jgi:hypothetical protein
MVNRPLVFETHMTCWRYILSLQLAATCALGQVPQKSTAAGMHEQPEAVVRSLYREIVARHPVGIPHGDDREHIAPYLSRNLITRIDTTRACERDYFRQHPDPHLKPPFDWLEMGLFSGGNEEALPTAFRLNKTEPSKDGGFRVYLALTYGQPTSLKWHVAVVVVPKNEHFVVDDVILQNDATADGALSVSEILTHGCDGPRWIGYGAEKDDSR